MTVWPPQWVLTAPAREGAQDGSDRAPRVWVWGVCDDAKRDCGLWSSGLRSERLPESAQGGLRTGLTGLPESGSGASVMTLNGIAACDRLVSSVGAYPSPLEGWPRMGMPALSERVTPVVVLLRTAVCVCLAHGPAVRRLPASATCGCHAAFRLWGEVR